MKTYVVQPGDTLGTIAKRFFGDAGRYRDIAAANNIEDPNLIAVGAVLKIPDLEEEGGTAPGSGAAGAGVTLTSDQLQQIMTKASKADIEKYLQPLNDELPAFQINTPLRLAHFIAQVAHESGSFRYSAENLNFSAEALREVFGKYFPTDELAEEYARKPEKIANRVYGNRMGNGDEASGDGWKYRGRGLIQLTGHDNYARCGQAIGLNLEEEPDRVADDPTISVKAVGWFWQSNNLNSLADADDVRAVTKRINGGYHGLKERTAFLERAKSVLMS